MSDELKLDTPLRIDEIDFRIQSINKGGYATILAYKDARADIRRLNAVCGVYGWQRQHTRDNHNCIVSLWDTENAQWVSKEDTGTESNTEQQKGLASDSFKRACFNWGIGIELYDYPVIQVKLNANEWELKEWQGKKSAKATWNLKLKDWIWYSEFEDGKVSFLSAVDDKGIERFVDGKKDISGQIAPEPINQEHVDYAVTQYRELVDADIEDGEKFPKMQAIDRRLSNDERIATMAAFGKDKYENGRLYRT